MTDSFKRAGHIIAGVLLISSAVAVTKIDVAAVLPEMPSSAYTASCLAFAIAIYQLCRTGARWAFTGAAA